MKEKSLMNKYGIILNGNPVMCIEFLGPREYLYREHVVVTLQFDTLEEANEVASIWPEATVIEIKNNLLAA